MTMILLRRAAASFGSRNAAGCIPTAAPASAGGRRLATTGPRRPSTTDYNHGWYRDQVSRYDASLPLEGASTPPSSWYTRFHKLEREAVFFSGWIAAAVAPVRGGDYATGEILGEEKRTSTHPISCGTPAFPRARAGRPRSSWRPDLNSKYLIISLRSFDPPAPKVSLICSPARTTVRCGASSTCARTPGAAWWDRGPAERGYRPPWWGSPPAASSGASLNARITGGNSTPTVN